MDNYQLLRWSYRLSDKQEISSEIRRSFFTLPLFSEHFWRACHSSAIMPPFLELSRPAYNWPPPYGCHEWGCDQDTCGNAIDLVKLVPLRDLWHYSRATPQGTLRTRNDLCPNTTHCFDHLYDELHPPLRQSTRRFRICPVLQEQFAKRGRYQSVDEHSCNLPGRVNQQLWSSHGTCE
jgi:hypothetical protein